MARALLLLLLVALLPAASARGLEASPPAPPCLPDGDADADLVQAVACVKGTAVGLVPAETEVRVDLPLRVELPDPLAPQGDAPEASAGPAPSSLAHETGAAVVASREQAVAGRAVAGMSVAAALTALGWTLLRFCGVAPLLPFFSRIEDDQLTAHPARRAALDVIHANPGATIQDIQAALGLAWGTTVHHLRRLDRAGLIAVRRDGARRGHWPLGQAPPRDGLSSADRAVAALVKSSPGLTQRDIARLAGVGAPAACKRLARLEEAGLVSPVREGRTRLYVPTSRLAALDVQVPATQSVVRAVTPMAGTAVPEAAPLPAAVATG
jgi:DNA-binding transcriptional ArsR family regulator